ncbi:MAG: HU family DNA-binding protein [Tannerella sp.]|jgi:nucleoid DNA-binding protein|nr:HU family DNA-binding protein [Tannerella sp.]
MDDRFSIYDIAQALSTRTGIKVKDADKFLSELVEVVNERVRQDGEVKVRGLGVFKVVLVKERESVHVNTGERIVIPAHHKLTFLPEKDLKDMVNKPFAAFETTRLSDVESQDESLVANMQIIGNEPEGEYIDEKPDEETTVLPPKPVETPRDEEETTVLPPPPVSKPAETPAPPPPVDEDTTLITPEQPVIAPPPPPVKSADDETIVIPPPRKQTVETPEPEPQKKDKSLTPWYIALAAAVVLFLGVVVYYLWLSDSRPAFMSFNRTTKVTGDSFALPGDSAALREAQEKARTVVADTVIQHPDTIKTVETPPVSTATIPSSNAPKTEKEKTSKPVTSSTANTSPSSSKTVAKVKMQPGQRLTLLALEYYGDKIFWVYIYEYNKAKIGSDPNQVPVGMELSIPDKSVYGIDAGSASSREKARQKQAALMSR